MTHTLHRTLIVYWLAALAIPQFARAAETNQIAGKLITFNTNGGWCWYQDERVVVDPAAGKLLISSIANGSSADGAQRNGDVDIVSYDLATGHIDRTVLHRGLGADDHNVPALLVRPDGLYLAMYTKHGGDKFTRYRISAKPHDATRWEPEQTFDWARTPGSDFNATYSNLFYVPAEKRVYDFTRANNRGPNILVSKDDGTTWSYTGKLVFNPKFIGYVNGYFKYASNGVDRIDFVGTEHHPRDFNNNIYHGFIRGGKMYRPDGSLVDPDIFDNDAPNQTALTRVFQSDSDDAQQAYSHAWPTDLHVDAHGNPYAIFSTRENEASTNGKESDAHRFWYARYDGREWHVHKLAQAGARLYDKEQDYTGLAALDPHNANRLFISTTIDPRDDKALGVHEIFEGGTNDGGKTWKWSPITYYSKMDNLRPIVPIWDANRTVLLWLRGKYTTMHDYDQAVVGLTKIEPLQ